jgi:hypothetical protein
MKGSEEIFTLLIFPLFSIAVAFTACSAPVGSLLADGSTDTIKVVLRPRVFHINTVFMPENVQVWKTSRSSKEPELVKDTDNIKISINDDLGEKEVNQETGFPLKFLGTKTVTVSYMKMEDFDSIQVVEPWVPIDDGGGIIISPPGLP